MQPRSQDSTRVDGRLVVNPTQSPGAAGTSFPYGGVQVGAAIGKVIEPQGETLRIWDEATGGTLCSTDADNAWRFACQLRGWDDEAVEHFLRGGYRKGDRSQRAIFEVPGSRWPGQDTSSRAVRLLLVPDAGLLAQSIYLWNGIPDWDTNAEAAYSRGVDFAIPLVVDIQPDDQNRWLFKGRLSDLYL